MKLEELKKLIKEGENSSVEFKRDDLGDDQKDQKGQLAREMAALLNSAGGYILLGVENDGSISGLGMSHQKVEELVMNISRDSISPPATPHWEVVEVVGKSVGIIRLDSDSPERPYKARVKEKMSWVTYIRAMSQTRQASREEEKRLYDNSPVGYRYERKPVYNSSFEGSIDIALARYYFVQQKSIPPDEEIEEERLKIMMRNRSFLTEQEERYAPTVAGMLLFGKHLADFLPQAAIEMVSYENKREHYKMNREVIQNPLVHIKRPDGEMTRPGLIDLAMRYVLKELYQQLGVNQDQAQQERLTHFTKAVREAIVNAIAHRDYSLEGEKIAVRFYEDNLEVLSPGNIFEGVALGSIKEGRTAHRNPMIVNVMKDLNFMRNIGMGISHTMLRQMRQHHGSEPELIAEDGKFMVRFSFQPLKSQ